MTNETNGHRCMTQAEYARYADLDPSYINRLVTARIIPLNADGRIDPVVADAARRRCINLRMPSQKKRHQRGTRVPPAPDPIDEAVCRLLYALGATVEEDCQYVVVIRFGYVGQDQGQWALEACSVGNDAAG
jgi:hypothetical protein